MASIRKQKEALRIAVFAYIAGAHYVTEEVEGAQSLSPGGNAPEAIEMRHAMLEADYERLRDSLQSIDMLVDMLDEEDLYPFGSEWPREAFAMLMAKLICPKLTSESESEPDCRFRFKKGFKAILNEIAAAIDSQSTQRSSLDHWMALLINTAFHAGAVIAARNAECPKLYYAVIPEIEEETEPWNRYPQLSDLLDRQLRRETRRKTGLVSDLDY